MQLHSSFQNNIKNILLLRRKTILSALVDEEGTLTNIHSNTKDISEFAFELSDKDVISSLSSQQRNTLKQIDAALSRLNSASFGLCKVCQQPIEESRLEIIPFTELCMKHKENL